jgi:midasin (ATPase involved in ribosome maturation)
MNELVAMDEEEKIESVTVREYLERLASAARQLAVPGRNGDDVMATNLVESNLTNLEEHCASTTSGLLRDIAQSLLQACRVDVLASSIDNLPPPPPPNQSRYDVVPEDDENYQDTTYRFRRIDHLRLLLRSMAPVAVDVVALVVQLVAAHGKNSNSNSSSCTPEMQSMAAFVLLSTWLEVAPHIVPLMTDLMAFLYQDDKESKEEISTTTTSSSMTTAPPLPRLTNSLALARQNLPIQQQCVVLEAALAACQFYLTKRRHHATLRSWWNWGVIFAWLDDATTSVGTNIDDDPSHTIVDAMDVDVAAVHQDDPPPEPDSSGDGDDPLDPRELHTAEDAVLWYAVRIASLVRNYSTATKIRFYTQYKVRTEYVPWLRHAWNVEHEELVYEQLILKGRTKIWWNPPFALPSTETIRSEIPLHPYLVSVGGEGLIFCKYNAISIMRDLEMTSGSNETAFCTPTLVHTRTTRENLAKIGVAMCIERQPILICGSNGAGKSSLIRELARLMFEPGTPTEWHDSSTQHQRHLHDYLLEIHVDEETDTKTLVGSYTVTDIPGEFEWRPGALTRAVKAGQWVLLEDLDKVPLEIQASLEPLFKERLLPLGNGQSIPCHPNFRLFATLTTSGGGSGQSHQMGRAVGGRRLQHPALWTLVQVDPLPVNELQEIAQLKYRNIPQTVLDATLAVFQALDQSGRMDSGSHEMYSAVASKQNSARLWIGRDPSVRDLFKVLSRIANGIHFEPEAKYVTESQRTLCLAEAVDVFAVACPSMDARREFIVKFAAPLFGITADLGIRYVETRGPTILLHETSTEVGRVQIAVSPRQAVARTRTDNFAQTSYVLRLMESIGVCVRENEPVLLVGETGTGKTSVLQHLAHCCGRELLVQNLSLQTDSTDLLGGYRPLEMQHLARKLYQEFVDLFTGTFSRKQNAEFLSFASNALQKAQWTKLSQCFRRASRLGSIKLKSQTTDPETVAAWQNFASASERFEQQRMACDSGMAFVFSEGALVDAIRNGKWVLLDEINLASSETLQRLCGLLDDSSSSLTLTERGDTVAVERHLSFRLFAAMNPATDSGKKDLTASIRARFTEMYVSELIDPVELRLVASRYLTGVLPAGDKPPEHTDTVINVVDLYLQCRNLAEGVLVDGSGQKPRYTLRTLTRALTAARTIVLEQKLTLHRALYEGFQLAFQGPLEEKSLKTMGKLIGSCLGSKIDMAQIDHPGRRPGGRGTSDNFVLIKPFWINAGPIEPVDWSEENLETGRSRFVLTPSTALNLRKLARAIAAGPWPVLLEGPTSAGKTTLVEYIAARCGHHVVRINNHEHTDIQEYTGGFVADSNGSLSFVDGLLVRALRLGQWVILDELNLAPSEVLEALNRLLDDNRELYLSEINETVKPHFNFRLFATQNPSGAYGGRKPLSRAFRNRFVEIQVNDIPSTEMVTILKKRCGCPPSHAKILVSVMDSLRQRRSKSGVFLGKDGFITPRDLLRWADRDAPSKIDLACEGYMLLAERLRTEEEKACVKEEIERHLRVSIDVDKLYYGDDSDARAVLSQAQANGCENSFVSSIALTKSLMRLITLVKRCVKQKEPVLLVGGKLRVLPNEHILESFLSEGVLSRHGVRENSYCPAVIPGLGFTIADG